MKKLIIGILIVSAITLAGCSTGRYSTFDDRPSQRNGYYNDPFLYGPGYYDPYGYGYRPGLRYYNPYQNNRYYNRRRPPVIIRKSPSTPASPRVKVKPINPRTDRWNPKENRRRN